MKTRMRPILNLFFLLSILIAGLINASTANAQIDQDGWVLPVNISSSGAASDPVIAIDSEGVFHILWKDEFSGLIYVGGDGTEWSEPEPVFLPFDTYLPHLLADRACNIHAFWIAEKGGLHTGRGA